MVIMALIFAVIYPKTLARVGYRYHDAILVPQQEGGNTVYSGKIDGGQAQFIVSENKSVVLQYRDKTYGPYMIQENPTAIPEDKKFENGIIGIEVFNGDKVLFRGGLVDYGDAYWLYNEDGTLYGFEFSYAPDYGLEVDQDGNEVDKMTPSAYTIYELLNQPKLTHNGRCIRMVRCSLCLYSQHAIHIICRRAVQMESIVPDPKHRGRRAVRLGNSGKVHGLDSFGDHGFGNLYYRVAVMGRCSEIL